MREKNFAGIGVWKLLSYESQVDDGSVTYPFGKDAVGQIIYDTKGNMSAQLADMHRPSFASDNLRLSTPGEINVAFKGQSNNPSCCSMMVSTAPETLLAQLHKGFLQESIQHVFSKPGRRMVNLK